jgi:hypothetical protein
MEANNIWIIITAIATGFGVIITLLSILVRNSKKIGRIDQNFKHVENVLTNLPCKDNTKQVIENSQQLKYHEDRLNDLPCEEQDKKMDSLQKNIVELKVDVSSIKTNISSLKTSFEILLKTVVTTNKQSPSHLNELGLKVYEDMDGEQFLNQYADTLIEKIEEISPKTAYDLENVALSILLSLKDDDIFIPIKDILYDYPEVEAEGTKKEITILDVCHVLRIPLRDKYLKLHPEILPKKYQLSQKEE